MLPSISRLLRISGVCLVLYAPLVEAQEADLLSGRWTGTYQCAGQPVSRMILDIAASNRPLKEAIFSFDAGGTTGSYSVVGRVRGGAQFRFAPRAWIDRADGISMLGLIGILGRDGQSMTGSLQGCPSGSFHAERNNEGEAIITITGVRLPEGDRISPKKFGGAIAGLLGRAGSAEAQCRVLAEWYTPVIDPHGFERMPSHKIVGAIAPIFRNEAFEPVFGMPLELMGGMESREIGRFLKETCYGKIGMDSYRNVFADVFRSPIYLPTLAATNEEQDKAQKWLSDVRAELAAISPEHPNALRDISNLDRKLAGAHRVNVSAQIDELKVQAAALRTEAEAAARTALFNKLLADLEGVGNDYDAGHLGTALRVADEARASKLEPGRIDQVVAAARDKAAAILNPRLDAAAGLATMLPRSLEGLIKARDALEPLAVYRDSMDRTFGSLDPEGRLRPLYDQISELEGDPSVIAELKNALDAAAASEKPRENVERLVAQVTSSGTALIPAEMAELIASAREDAEINAVVITDLSGNPDPSEPSAREIAAFAMKRVRDASSEMAGQEAVCTSGRVTDPVQAMKCLSNPALWTGQTGSRVTLLGVTKVGCEPEVKNRQYLCYFNQQVRIDIAGSQAYGTDWGQMTQELSGKEIVDARFFRAAGGGWTVTWGDLR